LNFDAFLPLFGENALKIPVAILTDSDPPGVYPKAGEKHDSSAAAKIILACAKEVARFV
jgi:putative ATP-dependent endonuclease of OLD family